MEDYQCFLHMYCYSTRIDLPPEDHQLVTNWIKKYKMKKWCLVHETAPKSKKLHYQGIIWFDKKPEYKRARAMREYWNGKLKREKKTDQPFSLKVCYSTCFQLARYCLKEWAVSPSIITNLTPPERERMRLFKTKKERTQEKKKKLERLIEKYKETNKAPAFNDYCYAYMDFYKEVYNTYPRNRIQYYMTGLTYNIITKEQFLKAIGVDFWLDRWEHQQGYNKLSEKYQSTLRRNEAGYKENLLLKKENNYLKSKIKLYPYIKNNKIERHQNKIILPTKCKTPTTPQDI